jgi:hypothetical protein
MSPPEFMRFPRGDGAFALGFPVSRIGAIVVKITTMALARFALQRSSAFRSSLSHLPASITAPMPRFCCNCFCPGVA